jgi:pilus assembly protein Flp/PilA
MLNLLSARLTMLRREEGQGLVEYALIIALVAIVVIAALVLIGGNITNAFNSIGSSIGGGGS